MKKIMRYFKAMNRGLQHERQYDNFGRLVMRWWIIDIHGYEFICRGRHACTVYEMVNELYFNDENYLFATTRNSLIISKWKAFKMMLKARDGYFTFKDILIELLDAKEKEDIIVVPSDFI